MASNVSANESKIILELLTKLDDILENATIKKQPITALIKSLIPIAKEYFFEPDEIFVYTYNESLAKQLFCLDNLEATLDLAEIDSLAKNKSDAEITLGNKYLYISKIDVMGEYFGYSGAIFKKKLDANKKKRIFCRIKAFNEILDNYLKSMQTARIKQNIINSLMKALRDPILEKGIDNAIEILQKNLNFKCLMLFFWQMNEFFGYHKINYRIADADKIIHNSANPDDHEFHQMIIKDGRDVINGELPTRLVKKYPLENVYRKSLSYGITNKQSVGYIFIEKNEDEMSIYDQDILDNFNNILIQRIVDFDKEYKYLAQFFSEKDIQVIIQCDNYNEGILKPKEKEVSILFADINSFTKISEQILVKPLLIGQLFDTWTREVVKIIWENNGVLDKFVGDCVIGLYGPPMFDRTPSETCMDAIKSALAIQKYTNSLNDEPEWKQIKDSELVKGITVGIGVNFAPLYAGMFGPNRDYTGFSSGMNNAARLQSLAGKNEILVMDNVMKIIGENPLFLYGEKKQQAVKNVQYPIEYYNIYPKK